MFVIKGGSGFDMMETHSLRGGVARAAERGALGTYADPRCQQTQGCGSTDLVPGFSLLLGPDPG